MEGNSDVGCLPILDDLPDSQLVESKLFQNVTLSSSSSSKSLQKSPLLKSQDLNKRHRRLYLTLWLLFFK